MDLSRSACLALHPQSMCLQLGPKAGGSLRTRHLYWGNNCMTDLMLASCQVQPTA